MGKCTYIFLSTHLSYQIKIVNPKKHPAIGQNKVNDTIETLFRSDHTAKVYFDCIKYFLEFFRTFSSEGFLVKNGIRERNFLTALVLPRKQVVDQPLENRTGVGKALIETKINSAIGEFRL